MGDRSLGVHSRLLGNFETVYGTPDGGAGTHRRLRFQSTSLGAEKDLAADEILGAGRSAQDPFYNATIDVGDAIVPIDLNNSGFWFHGMFGAETVSGAGDFTHEWTDGLDEIPSASLEVQHPKMTVPAFFLNQGVKFDGLSFDMAREGGLLMTIPLIAQGEVKSGASTDTAPLPDYAYTRFNRSRGLMKLDAAQLGNLTGGTFAFTNGLEAVETIRNDGLIEGVDELVAACTGEITVRFTNLAALEDAGENETPVALIFEHSTAALSATQLIRMTLPRVFLKKAKGEVSGPGGVSKTYPWIASKDAVAGHMLKVELLNQIATYP